MTVHPFRPRANQPVDPPVDPATPTIEDDDAFPYDFNEDFAEFDDSNEDMRRFGSIDVQYRYAHRTLSAPLLAMLTDVQIPDCQAFHRVLFALLEDVGDFDGLVATPHVIVAGRPDRVAAARGWLTEHPPPDVAALHDALLDGRLDDDHVTRCIERHSLGLAQAAGSNPSLTIGSLEALQHRLIGDVLDILISCSNDDFHRLTDMVIRLLARLPDSLGLVGGAVVVPVHHGEPPPLSV